MACDRYCLNHSTSLRSCKQQNHELPRPIHAKLVSTYLAHHELKSVLIVILTISSVTTIVTMVVIIITTITTLVVVSIIISISVTIVLVIISVVVISTSHDAV